MLTDKTRLPFFLICILLLFNCSFAFSQRLSLKIAGDNQKGFRVDVYNGQHLVVTNTEEFSIQLYNHDLSTEAWLKHWTGQKWTGNDKIITLKRDSYIPEFDANLSVSVTYQVVNAHVIKKTIELFQPSMPDMLYILKETSRPAETPKRYVTFDYDSFPGGLVHEMFPSAGFITPDNNVVGFLSPIYQRGQIITITSGKRLVKCTTSMLVVKPP